MDRLLKSTSLKFISRTKIFRYKFDVGFGSFPDLYLTQYKPKDDVKKQRFCIFLNFSKLPQISTRSRQMAKNFTIFAQYTPNICPLDTHKGLKTHRTRANMVDIGRKNLNIKARYCQEGWNRSNIGIILHCLQDTDKIFQYAGITNPSRCTNCAKKTSIFYWILHVFHCLQEFWWDNFCNKININVAYFGQCWVWIRRILRDVWPCWAHFTHLLGTSRPLVRSYWTYVGSGLMLTHFRVNWVFWSLWKMGKNTVF